MLVACNDSTPLETFRQQAENATVLSSESQSAEDVVVSPETSFDNERPEIAALLEKFFAAGQVDTINGLDYRISADEYENPTANYLSRKKVEVKFAGDSETYVYHYGWPVSAVICGVTYINYEWSSLPGRIIRNDCN
jgi:hypothetical protein